MFRLAIKVDFSLLQGLNDLPNLRYSWAYKDCPVGPPMPPPLITLVGHCVTTV
jgi:hypothetical protein